MTRALAEPEILTINYFLIVQSILKLPPALEAFQKAINATKNQCRKWPTQVLVFFWQIPLLECGECPVGEVGNSSAARVAEAKSHGPRCG